MNRIKRHFITGLLVVVPVFGTLSVLVIAFRFVDNILGRVLNFYLKEKLGFYIPGAGILITLIIILCVGFLANRFIGRKMFPRIEKWFAALPLVKNIYPTFKKIILFILAQKEFGFKKVVLVEYPSKGIWSIGFITNEQFARVNRVCGREMVAVFMPTTPGPITGYVVFFAKEELRFPDISVSDALKIIISAGVFKPEG